MREHVLLPGEATRGGRQSFGHWIGGEAGQSRVCVDGPPRAIGRDLGWRRRTNVWDWGVGLVDLEIPIWTGGDIRLRRGLRSQQVDEVYP